MVATESSEKPTAYEFEPFEHVFLRRREQIIQLVDVTGHAMRSMQGFARLSEKLQRPPEVVERVREIELLALAEVRADLPLLHGAATVLIWGVLETAFRDFLVRWLFKNPSARRVPELRNVRVRVAEYESFDGEDRMRHLVSILERELGAALRPGAGRFECLLRPFNISPQLSDVDRRTLNELAAVRNAIVHRAGIADERLLELCPRLGLNVGDPVNVTRTAFHEYVRVTSHYAAAIIDSAERSGAQASSNGGPAAS